MEINGCGCGGIRSTELKPWVCPFLIARIATRHQTAGSAKRCIDWSWRLQCLEPRFFRSDVMAI
jgi:hypothetical protein